MADNLTPITSDQLSKVTTAQDTDLVTLGINGNFVSMTLANLKEVLGINALNTKTTDSDWITDGICKYRKKNGIVFIFIYSTETEITTSYQTLMTLPAGYRPNDENTYASSWSADGKGLLTYVSPYGVVSMKALVSGTRFPISFISFPVSN